MNTEISISIFSKKKLNDLYISAFKLRVGKLE